MYFRIEKLQDIIRVNDDFASLKAVHPDGSLEFEFLYSIRQVDAVKKSTKVHVTILSRNVDKKAYESSYRFGKIDSAQAVNDILTEVTRAKTASRYQDNYVVFKKVSDVSAHVNNNAVGEIKLNRPIDKIQSMYRTKIKSIAAGELKRKNDAKPILHKLLIDQGTLKQKADISARENTELLSKDLILRRGKDPSDIRHITSKVQKSKQSFQGTFNSTLSREEETGTLARLHDHFFLYDGVTNKVENDINDVDDARTIDVVVNEVSDLLTIPVRARFIPPIRKITAQDSSNLFVKFELIDQSSGVAIDSVDRILKVHQFLEVYETPVVPPVVKQTGSSFSKKTTLNIQQVDPAADEIHVYKKVVQPLSVENDAYRLVEIFSLRANEQRSLSADRFDQNAVIYRCIPAKSGNLCGAFTNAVIKPTRFVPTKSLALSSKNENNGVTLEARSLSPDIISVQFMYRNLTTRKKNYEPIGEPILVNQQSIVTTSTPNVVDGNVYEFVAKAYFKDGSEEILDNETIEFVAPTPGKLDIKIENINVKKSGEFDLQFDVDLSEINTDLSDIKKILENQGMKSYFDDDVKKQRDELQNLLTYSVHRVNLTTGEREDLGFVSDKKFSDKNARGKFSAKVPKSGNGYRYIVSAASRTAETALEKLEKNAIDKNSKKNYKFNPSKFLHPIALKRGVITTPLGRKSLYAKSTFEHGTIGVQTIHEINLSKDSVTVVNASVNKLGSNKNLITWQTRGDLKEIDHFVIMKEIHGIRTVVGAAHSQFSSGNCSWVHSLSDDDSGQITYVIVPVMSDYKTGQAIFTNFVLVG